MPRPPVIGISSYGRDGKPEAFSLPCGYVDGVRVAGGVPLVLPPGETQADVLLDLVDGLVLAGGGDIAPAIYGGQPHATVYLVSEERDQFEITLVREALARKALPVLCICRGMQVLNVVCGGSLHTHLPERFGNMVSHRLPPREPARHRVRVHSPSRLEGILGDRNVDVCSWHHQAIDRLGENLRPLAWASDGVIEAIEHAAHAWCLGVQWHPEMQLEEPPHQRLFSALVAAASAEGDSAQRALREA